MKRLKLYIAAHAMLIWLIAIILLMTASVSFGAYTYMKYAKRVVSTINDDGIQFSSNLLAQTSIDSSDSSLTSMLFTFSKNEDGDSRRITVCNYPQNDIYAVNQGDVEYRIKIKVKNADGSDMTYDKFQALGLDINLMFENKESNEELKLEKVRNTENANFQSEKKYTLKQKVSERHAYVLNLKLSEGVDYDTFDFTEFYLVVSAEPSDGSVQYTNNTKLAKNFIYTRSKENQGWSGKFVDNFSVSRLPEDYDGFNYEIKGSGEGTVTLTWNSNFIAIDPHFRESLETEQIVSSDDTSDNSLSFKVGGNYTRSNYRIQFYRVVPAPENETLENGIVVSEPDGEKYVEFAYEPDDKT